MKVVIALDIGSSSIRCGAYRVTGDGDGNGDGDGAVEPIEGCSSQRKMRTVEPNTGKILLTNEDGKDLFDEIDLTVDDTLDSLRRMGDKCQVCAVGFSTFCMNFIAVDDKGNPIGKKATLSYACNTDEVASECRLLKSILGRQGQKTLYQRTGTPLHSGYALPQLRALYTNVSTNQDDSGSNEENIVMWQTLASICLSRWQGTPFSNVSFSEASWTGLFNFRSCEWDKEAIALLPEAVRDTLPPLCDYSDKVNSVGGIGRMKGGVDSTPNPYWDRWPELRVDTSDVDGGISFSGCKMFLGIGDGACANIGSWCGSCSKIAVTIGTSAAARVCLPLPANDEVLGRFVVPEGLFCYRVDREHVLIGGALTDGGSVIEWATDLLNLHDRCLFDKVMSEVGELLNSDYANIDRAPGSESRKSISVSPFLSGERSTGYREGACFCMMGLTRESKAADFLKASMEGVILRLGKILELIRINVEDGKGGGPRLMASGTGLERNGIWRQMLADCSGLEVELDTSVPEKTSFGCAMLALVAFETENKEGGDDSGSLYLGPYQELEPKGTPERSSPRLTLTEKYWVPAMEEQEKLIEGVSRLW